MATVDCAEPHTAEVFATFTLAGAWDATPSSDELLRRADEICQGDVFEEYVGVDAAASGYEPRPLYPTEAGWAAEDPKVVCLLISDIATIGAARGSGS